MTGRVIEVETPGSQHIVTLKDIIGRSARYISTLLSLPLSLLLSRFFQNQQLW
jgi:hypothetical protein